MNDPSNGLFLLGTGRLPKTEALAGSLVRLPLFPDLDRDDACRIVDGVKRCL